MPGKPARLFLTGFSASGKTTFGRRWARRLEVPFLDTDEWIARETGMTPHQWIVARGEAAFRQVETEAIERLLQERGPMIIALGGGSITIPGMIEKLSRAGWLLWIDPPWSWLVQRLQEKPRPLQLGRPPNEWHSLWQQRRPYYRQSDLHWPPHLISESSIFSWVQRQLSQ